MFCRILCYFALLIGHNLNQMEFTASQIAELINGKVEGDPGASVSNVSRIEEGKKGTLSFLANPKYIPFIYETKASIVIVNEDFKPEKKIAPTLIRVSDAYSAFAKLIEYYDRIRSDRKGISEKASVARGASFGKDVYIGHLAVIEEGVRIGDGVKIYPDVFVGENVVIGNNTVIFPGVRIYHDTEIGANCRIHAGVIIGSDGFGFAPQDDSNYVKVAQIGNVVIGNNVEIGSNTTIDRATMGSTIIHDGVKLDNLIQIAHNVVIGENTVIAAQTGISGSTRIGRNCMIGGQVGIIGHLTIADDVKIAAQSGIGASITKQGAIVQGSPAFEIGKYRRSYVHFRKLDEMDERISRLEKDSD